MRFTRFCCAMVVLAVLWVPFTRSGADMSPTLQHTTITIQAGVLGDSADTHLYEYAPNDRDAWWISTFRVGYSHPYERGRYHGLLRFDLSPIPPGATVTHAQLELYSDGWSEDGSAIIVGAYAVLRDTVIHEATWSEFQVGQPWRQPGCDYVGTDRLGEAAGMTQFEGIQRWYQLELTQAVRSWVSGDLDNNGALLRVESGNGFFAISSRDGYDVSRRPKLVVTYADGPSPTATTTTPTPSPSPTTAETTTMLQNGLGSYSGSTDTYLYEFAPLQNYCDQNLLAVGHGQRYASWVRFDLSSLPTGVDISHASLEVFAFGWAGSDMELEAFRVLREVHACEATWDRAQLGHGWGLPGCNHTVSDRGSTPEDAVGTSGVNAWYRFDITPLVRDWTGGVMPNYGVLLRGGSPASRARVYLASSDHRTTSQRPKLIITYRGANHPMPTPTVVTSTTPRPSATATSTQVPAPEVARLRIGHVTDAHIGLSWIESQRLPLVVSTASREVDVIVDTGNCTEHGTATEYAEYVDSMTESAAVPWRTTVGSSDTGHTFEEYIGPLQWVWDVGGYRLIGVNTNDINYAALDAALTDTKPCILFGHLPLEHLTPEDQSKLRQRFVAHAVPIYVAGHIHSNTLEADGESGTLLLTGQRTVRCHYRVITLHGFEVEGVEFEMACH